MSGILDDAMSLVCVQSRATGVAFAHNKMHKPWTVELAALFEVET